MSQDPPDAPADAPLDLKGLHLWLVERGMQGLPVDEQIGAFCCRVLEQRLSH